jgi:ABC-type protease/lipase transport system fused ATPase/permease subunit
VRENIARMGEGDPEAVVKAAQLAGVHQMILGMAKGYDTEIGPGGAALSGGQRQRIGLARALYGNPRLVVLDEPNANLDSEGEAALVRALGYMKQAGVTCVVIAHRPSVVQGVDKLLMLKDGTVVMFGARDEVLEKLRSNREQAIAQMREQQAPAAATADSPRAKG